MYAIVGALTDWSLAACAVAVGMMFCMLDKVLCITANRCTQAQDVLISSFRVCMING